MNRLLRFAAYAYPRKWRHRYAAEFDALLDDMTPRWFDLLDVFRGALGVHMRSLSNAAPWKIVAVFTVIGVITGITLSFLIPSRYTSSAVLRFDGSPRDVNDLAVATLTRKNLGTIINSHNVYANVTAPLEDKVERLKRALRVGFAGNKLYGIVISFEDTDPEIAHAVTSDIVQLFQRANTALSVLDPPNTPRQPSMPNIRTILILCTLTGIFVGALVAAFTARMYNPPQLPA